MLLNFHYFTTKIFAQHLFHEMWYYVFMLEEHYDFDCPYCGSENSFPVDFTGEVHQSFVVDCETCCAPITIRLRISGDEVISVDIRRENE